MHPVEILLPLRDNSGRPFAAETYAEVRQILTERFGGLTAFPRSPAQGTTTGGGHGARRDCRVRSHDRKRWTRVVEELPNSVGAGLPAALVSLYAVQGLTGYPNGSTYRWMKDGAKVTTVHPAGQGIQLTKTRRRSVSLQCRFGTWHWGLRLFPLNDTPQLAHPRSNHQCR
jgi:hypothetical protein